ncbi:MULTISPECIES: hypothetical protein [Paenibacillus]|uniref:Uncharacterized protein n=3 Tax=Paenibacillus lactis TaxID=228574 RepID=G4HF62_9BACL|nr:MULTISPECIES: hypothetical protein [Paenibacillus]EHB64379.1 hypothetical protein PaelaDRAFT_2623 [Paenibacillus lactis 154]MBP1892925.1 hypothetical protein [Paenibacillus lactis]MCM3495238.1 hypothetical protein [Paenibacillus lactis]HAF97601.1 hypothetical protein [Paenibacillus lactis]
MNELSRMERHRSRNKGRKNKASSVSPPSPAAKPTRQDAGEYTEYTGLSRSKPRMAEERRTYTASAEEGLSRSRRKQSATQDNMEEATAPRRTHTYSSYRVRMSKWFVNSLIVIFILLMASLLWWGLIGAPPVSELIKELL